MITPTIGRVVWFHARQAQMRAATIAFVHSDSCVNLAVVDPSGKPYGRSSVPLFQGAAHECPQESCCWMPYQQKQAAKHEAENTEEVSTGKTLHNSTVSGARKNVSDLAVFGDGDTFKLISKASSKAECWMKSTKAMEIDGVGCVVQVTTQQGDNVAEALTFVPGVMIIDIDRDKANGRKLVCSVLRS